MEKEYYFERLCELANEGECMYGVNVWSLLQKGVDLNKKGDQGLPPLLIAGLSKQKEIVDQLIRYGADIHFHDDKNWTILHCASMYGWEDTVQYLVEHKVDLDPKVWCGKTPLLLAAEYQRKEVVHLLIRSGGDLLCCDDDYKMTVLHWASMHGCKDTVQLLVDYKVDLNVKNSYDEPQTPLMMAAEHGNKEVVNLLIRHGADIHCCYANKWSILHYASNRGWEDTVQSLLKKGADVNSRIEDGDTPLHIAVCTGQIKMASLLVKAGADWNMVNKKGKPAFFILLRRNDLENNIDAMRNSVEVDGAYADSYRYDKLLKFSYVKDFFLKDIALCTQSVINKHNLKHLPALYKLAAVCLPPIAKLHIKKDSCVAEEVEKAFDHEKQEKGFCNVFKARPMVLQMLCVQSFINYGNDIEQSIKRSQHFGVVQCVKKTKFC